jgi:hypothetical protein
MANGHLVLCGSARPTSRKKGWRVATPLRLRLGKEARDVHLRIDHISGKMCSGLPDLALDLVELAAYVYAADQVVTRGGTKEFEYGRRWRRHFRFEVPVRRPDAWQRPEVLAALSEVLGFLSDDDYEFGFTRLTDPPPLSRYLFTQTGADDAPDYQEVMLFSGGLDSLGGAVQEVLHGQRKVALVSHRPVSKLYRRQQDLVAEIVDRLPDRRLRPLHVAVEVNKGKGLGREFTQRTRSFLFAAFAAVVALLFGLRRVRFYENGVTSFNLPISPQVLGGRATRTTHPRVLKGFERLFSLLFDGRFAVENPFRWKTKADILKEVKAAGHGKLCAFTSSCHHTRAATAMHSHCGRCSQCVDRRLNALAAGLDKAEDPPEMYQSDVLTGPCDGAELTLVERYIGTARRIDRMQNLGEFVMTFTEVSRLLLQLDEPAPRAAELVFNLYRNHSRQIIQALAGVIGRESEEVVRWKYPANCLLSVACGRTAPSEDPRPGPQAPPKEDQAPSRLQLDQETFEAWFGQKSVFLGNTVEFLLLERLNRRPGVFVSVGVLQADVWHDRVVEKNTVQRTVSNVRRKLREAGITEIEIDGSQKDHYQIFLRQ